MVHAFQFDGKYFLYDINSGSLHICDEAAFFVVKKMCGEEVSLGKFSKEDLLSAQEDIDKLTDEESLFAPSPKLSLSNEPGEIKALCLHISHNCNMSCSYCFAGGGNYHGESGNMPFSVAKVAIDLLIQKSGNRKNLEVDFFGGEPLLNLDVVKQTVSYAKMQANKFNKLFKFTLTTNGLLLNDSAIDYLCKEMENVVLSVDGRPNVHNNVRKLKNGKGGTFDLVMDSFKKFKEKRGNKSYYVRGTFTAANLDFSEDVLFLNDLGFDQISIEPVVLASEHPLCIKEEHLPQIYSEYEKLAKEYIKRRKTDKWFNFFHFMIDLENGPCIKKRLTGCGAGGEYLAVTPSGNIYPCHQFAEEESYKIGNVFDGLLNQKIRCDFCSSNLLTKPSCQDCFAKYHCSGGCSANSIHYAGDINKPYELSCAMMKKRTECALAIYAIEKMGL